MAFSIGPTIDMSQGVTVNVRASSTTTLAACPMGTSLPY
jgi:hypothetical protein